MGETNGNESVVFRFIPAFVSFRCTINRVYNAIFAHLFRPFRATDVRGGTFTQGGARRLRRLALPWANLFCPFGAWLVFDAGRFRRGLAGLFGAWRSVCGKAVSSGLGRSVRRPVDAIRSS
jgi:hypothetical protein